jgi:hypothetical protein
MAKRHGASNIRGVIVSTSSAIVAIVRDPALLRALAFALQAHGHMVAAHRTWTSASEHVSGAGCVILDGCLSVPEREACLSTLRPETSILLLAEDDTIYGERPGLQVLHKPLSGADVVAALAALRGNP